MKAKQVIKSWKKLGKILKQLENGDFGELDKEVALQQLRELYGDILAIETEDESNEVEEEEKIKEADNQVKEVKKESEPEKEAKKEKEHNHAVSADLFTDKKQDIKTKEVESNKSSEPKSEKSEEENPSNEVEEKEKKDTTLGEKLGENKKAVNEKIKENSKRKDVANKIKSKPISDIKAAIGLGDRFLFIKDLFGGNADEFNSCIDKLNNAENIDQSHEIISSYNWDMNSETVSYFLSIVERKF